MLFAPKCLYLSNLSQNSSKIWHIFKPVHKCPIFTRSYESSQFYNDLSIKQYNSQIYMQLSQQYFLLEDSNCILNRNVNIDLTSLYCDF